MAMAVVYDTLDGVLLSEKRGATVTEYVSDPLGSLKTCNDSSGSVTYTATYWPYGELRSSTGSNPSPWGFAGLLGYLTDTASRLYVRMRHYLPKLTRWLIVDPLWPGKSAYQYANGEPIVSTDMSGLEPCSGSGSSVIPVPAGINPAVWAAVIRYLQVTLGLALEAVGLFLAAIAAILLLALTCDQLKQKRYDVCPNPSKNIGLSGCKGTDDCPIIAAKLVGWEVCAATQILIDVICYQSAKHGDATENYINAALKCSAMYFSKCWWLIILL